MANRSMQIRRPVRRHHAHTYILVMLVSFAVTEVVTRLFLTLTGFPKIGTGEIHLAHLLWGGLLLFISLLLLLIFANGWIFELSAILGGMGTGLFIDEVGKFITTSNDYFYPLAIPIIYAVVLVMVVVYLEVNRARSTDSRAVMYRVLEMFTRVLDRDWTPHEQVAVEERLKEIIANNDVPDITRLAQTLTDYLADGKIQLAPERADPSHVINQWLYNFIANRIGQVRLKNILIVGLGLLGIAALFEMLILLIAPAQPGFLESVLDKMVDLGRIRGLTSLNWFVVQIVAEGIIGVLLLISSFLLYRDQDRHGANLGYVSLLLSLTLLNLLAFYFNQFGNLTLTLIELVLFFGIVVYRHEITMPPVPKA